MWAGAWPVWTYLAYMVGQYTCSGAPKLCKYLAYAQVHLHHKYKAQCFCVTGGQDLQCYNGQDVHHTLKHCLLHHAIAQLGSSAAPLPLRPGCLVLCMSTQAM